MNWKSVKQFVITPLILCLFFLLGSGLTKEQAVQQLVVQGIAHNHYSPPAIDDRYSEKVFEATIKKLDPSKRIFTKQDISILSIHKFAIDDQLDNATYDFFYNLNDVYEANLAEIASFVPSLFDTPQTFKEKKRLETDPDKRKYMRNLDEIKAYWEDLVTYQILHKYIQLKNTQVTGNQVLDDSYDPELEKEAREKIEQEVLESITRLQEESTLERKELFLDALANVFDTHTGYFPPEKKEDFDINISGKLEGIGAVLREEDGFIKVVRIVPGSASWKQGELAAEDKILKVAEGDGPFVDIVGVRVKDAVKLIRGKKGKEVRLMVQHVSGETAIIPIIRDVVVIEETYTKHAVFKDSRYDKHFGYIYLPKFYRDFSNARGRNTTDDVRKALRELNKENVDGVILDLRYNEGGALVDAVNTAGLFIKSGPIVQVKGQSPSTRILRDTNSSVTYGGPLVILINTYSASASEILAAALQDYGRAVIIGSQSFGKGTVQTFIDLDRLSPQHASYFDEMGSIKVTIQKFYRINGGSTQHKGVEPDIILPDIYMNLEVGEEHLDHALSWGTVSPLYYNQWSDHPFDIQSLSQRSKKRLKKMKSHKTLLNHIDYITKKSEDTLVPLDLKRAVKKKVAATEENKAYSDSITDFETLEISIINEDSLSEAQAASYTEWKKELKKDLNLYETISILNDLSEQ